MHNKTIYINLSQDEALVLFEFVTRFSDDKGLSIEDQAEARVLWDICCVLESQLVTPINNANYDRDLEHARARVRDSENA